MTSLLAPITVAGNALVLAAIWRNPSLRIPSYVLLAGLAFTDFCSELLSQPSYVMYKLGEFTVNNDMMCTASLITQGVTRFLLFDNRCHSDFTCGKIAVRRSLLTRVVILYITFMVGIIAIVALRVYSLRFSLNDINNALRVVFVLTTLMLKGDVSPISDTCILGLKEKSKCSQQDSNL